MKINALTQTSFLRVTSFFILIVLLQACATSPSPAPNGVATAKSNPPAVIDSAPPAATSPTLHSATNNPDEEGETLEQLEGVADYLTIIVQKSIDAKFAHKKIARILACDPSSKTAERWMMQIKSRIDTKISGEQNSYLSENASTRAMNPRWTLCEKSCLCGTYAEMIDQIDADKLTVVDHELVKKMRVKHGKQSEADQLRCAKAVGWFCESPLRRRLIKEN